MAADLQNVRHVVLDMDGTLYKGSSLFPCTIPFLERLRRLGIGHHFVTNNCSHSKPEYYDRLREWGLQTEEGQIYTSADHTLDYLRTELPQVRRIALLGTPSLAAEFEAAGYHIDWNAPEAVVVAFDTNLTYARLCRAAFWIAQGLPFLATHPDLVCPTDEATVLVDCGAICACLAAATGRRPIVLGKPSPDVLLQICRRSGFEPREVAMVGDRLYTDMAMARGAGCISVLVLTGEAKREEAEAMDTPPDFIVPHLGVLGELLEATR